METELSTVVRDECGDVEQQPINRRPNWLYEPTYPEGVLKDAPKFDEHSMHHDEDGYFVGAKSYLWSYQL